MDRVVPSGEVAVGAPPLRVTVAGAGLLLTRLPEGRVVAFSATCPHQRTDLADATLGDGRVRCPLHLYQYDLETGENVVPARDLGPVELEKAAPGYLRVHPVEERDGWILVDRAPKPPPPSYVPPATSAPPVRPAEEGEVVRVASGTTFELRLPAPSRSGFVWRVETGGPLLAIVGKRADRGDHVVRLVARAPGRATVTCAYARPWDREPAEVRTYEVVVEGGYS